MKNFYYSFNNKGCFIINNLFDYATSELSQDAVISWLSQWGDNKYKSSNPILNQLGKKFIKLLSDNERMEIETVEIHKQYNHIDVVLVINKGEYIICVEDKVDSGIHSNQLYKYKNNITEKDEIIIDDKKYEYGEVIFCYFKTGDQNTFLSPLAHGYNTVNRESLLELFNSYSEKIDNDIFLNYFSYLEKLNEKKEESWYSLYKDLTRKLTLEFPEEEIKAAKRGWEEKLKNYSDTKEKDAKIKVDYLDKNIDKEKIIELAEDNIFIKKHFSYVPNQSGGFSAFYWGNYNKGKYNTYLQIGDYKYNGDRKYRLALRVSKLEEKNNDEKKEIREYLYKKFTEAYPEYYVKPTRFSIGNTMAFAVLKDYQDINFKELHDHKEKFDKLVNDLKRTLSHLDKLG